MEKNQMTFLRSLTTLCDARSCRASSWDQSGRNKDYWLIEPGQTVTLAEIDGPGCVNHIWMTSFCRKIIGPSIQDPILGSSVAPVTEMENAIGVNWEITHLGCEVCFCTIQLPSPNCSKAGTAFQVPSALFVHI